MNIPRDIQKTLRAKAKQKRISRNRAVPESIEERVDTTDPQQRRVYTDLDHLVGTWTSDEADAFDKALEEQRQIDPELWR